MKKHVVCFSILLFQSLLVGQTLTMEDKQRLIQDLDSVDRDLRFNAIVKIHDDSVFEAAPAIERVIFAQDADIADEMLMTLRLFHSPNLHDIAKRILDSADIFVKRPIDEKLRIPPLTTVYSLKTTALDCLFRLGDYSDVAEYFEILDISDTNLIMYGDELGLVLSHVPAYADSAKERLLFIVNNAGSYVDRWSALYGLINNYHAGFIPELVIIASSNTNPDIRYLALNDLYDLGYSDIHSFLIRQLSLETEWDIRHYIADSLLMKFGGPSDYEFVQQYALSVANDTAKRWISYDLKAFQPPVPSPSTPVSTMLDTLISFKHQAFAYNWIGDGNFVNELDNGLSNARKHLQRGDSVNCSREVGKFQDKVNKEYNNKRVPSDKRFVTIEGWKFLFYQSKYIVDRLGNDTSGTKK